MAARDITELAPKVFGKLEPLEAAAEVLKGAGGSLGGATKQEHSNKAGAQAFGGGSWTEKREGGLHGS